MNEFGYLYPVPCSFRQGLITRFNTALYKPIGRLILLWIVSGATGLALASVTRFPRDFVCCSLSNFRLIYNSIGNACYTGETNISKPTVEVTFALDLAVKGLRDTGSPVLRHDMLMNPNKGETAVHGCHCQGDLVVRMRKVLAIRRS